MGPGGQSHLPANPPGHLPTWIFSSKPSSHFTPPLLTGVFFFNSTSFPSRTYFPEIHRNFTFRFPPPAWFGCQQQESLPSLIFLGNQTKSCSWSWTTPDPFGKQEIQSGLAGDSVGRINISSALSTFSRSSFSSRGHGSILRQEKEMPAVQIPHPGSSAAGIYLPVEL